jgi:hypothetical protein
MPAITLQLALKIGELRVKHVHSSTLVEATAIAFLLTENGFTQAEACEEVQKSFVVDSYYLWEGIQKEQHVRDVWDAQDRGSSCSPSGEW